MPGVTVVSVQIDLAAAPIDLLGTHYPWTWANNQLPHHFSKDARQVLQMDSICPSVNIPKRHRIDTIDQKDLVVSLTNLEL